MSQIEALRKEARLYAATGNKATGAGGLAGDGSGGGGSGSGGADGKGGEGSPQAQLAALKKALDEAKENEVGVMFSCSHGIWQGMAIAYKQT